MKRSLSDGLVNSENAMTEIEERPRTGRPGKFNRGLRGKEHGLRGFALTGRGVMRLVMATVGEEVNRVLGK